MAVRMGKVGVVNISGSGGVTYVFIELVDQF